MGSQRVQHNLATEHSTVKGSFILFPLYYIFLILHFLIYCKLHWPILCPSKECKKSRIIFFICPDAYHFCCFFFSFLMLQVSLSSFLFSSKMCGVCRVCWRWIGIHYGCFLLLSWKSYMHTKSLLQPIANGRIPICHKNKPHQSTSKISIILLM